MAQRRVSVRPVKVFEVCPVPGCGMDLEYTGVALTVFPPKYKHECPRCHERVDLSYMSPKIEMMEQ